MWELPRKPSTLPIAPKAVDPALLHELLKDRAKLHAYAVVLVPRCAAIQRALTRGGFYSRKELSALQRQSRTVLMAARANRDLGNETLPALDRLTCFVSGMSMTTTVSTSTVAA